MNKKFSTLLCASLLFSSAFTAQAQDLSGALKGGDATEMSKLGSTTPKGVYQLRTSDGKILTVMIRVSTNWSLLRICQT